MRKHTKLLAVVLMLLIVGTLVGCSSDKKNEEGKNGFKASLDTEKKVTLNVMGFFGNFEALDEVVVDFNKFYPNVEFVYEQSGGDNVVEYLESNQDADIFMTSNDVLDAKKDELSQYCADLTKEKVDISAIEKDMLVNSYYDDKLVSIPIGQRMCGLVANVSLLKKEGLSIPQNYKEFLDVLETLKNKGYVPIQGASSKLYAELTYNMIFNLIQNDEELYNELKTGDENAVSKIKPVFDKLDTIIDNGYTDLKINQSYPEDNYDEAILRFFKGDVPFWVCDTEKVSGMKKRESKSEEFKKNPFEYKYIYAPIGDKGAYVYREPWYGFAVSKKSDDYDYAVEFMKFLATNDEINKMADIKGVPSVAKKKNDVKLYSNVIKPKNVESECVMSDSIDAGMVSNWYNCINQFVEGKFKNADEAIKAYIKLFSDK